MELSSTIVLHAAAAAAAPALSRRILEGTAVSSPRVYPFMAHLQKDDDRLCGGVILRPTKIVTAAHCVYEAYAYKLKVRVGSFNCSEGGKVHKVQWKISHQKYRSEGKDYDVGGRTTTHWKSR